MVIRILTYGDSLTEGRSYKAILSRSPRMPFTYQSKLYEQLEKAGFDVEIINEGIGGQVAGQIADYLIITAGTNDCWRWSDAFAGTSEHEDFLKELVEDTFNVVKDAVLKIKEKVRSKIIIVSIPPVRNTSDRNLPKNMLSVIKRINQKYNSFCIENGLIYCDLFLTMIDSEGYLKDNLHSGDGVHFSIEGNSVFGETVATTMLALLKK
jgi:lysophospholipase L1-like esterase